MTAGSAQRVEQLFCEALELPLTERRAFVALTCDQDAHLAAAVLALLDAAEEAESFLERPVEDCLDLPWGEIFRTDGETSNRAEEHPLDRSGERVGPYRLVRRIGRGGMASVYLAERADGQWRQEVAFKVIRRGVDTEDVIRRFVAERQILSSLTHPNIARLLGGGTTDDGLPYLVMEHVAGTPLLRHCDDRQLAVPERLRLFCEIGRAVQHAHGRLVVHRDLKPSNILVDSEGGVKLLDFGIAKLLEESVEEGITLAGMRPLTPSWASPEQVRGEPITTASDVYQLGLLLSELLVGRLPYETRAISPALTERAISQAEPTRPSALVTDEAAARRASDRKRLAGRIRGDLDTIVLKALKKQPQERYASAESMVEDVERHLGGQPVRARPDTLGYRGRKFVSRNRVGVVIAAAFAMLLIGSAVTAAFQARRLAHERDRALAEEARAERVTDFVTELFRAADPNAVGGKDVTALEILDAGTARALQELAGDPAAQADVLGAIGEMYVRRGLYTRAIPVLERALELRRTMGPDPVGLVLDTRRLARAVWRDDERVSALLRQAVALAEAELGPDDPQLAATLTDLAHHLMRQPELEAQMEAPPLIERALRILRAQEGDVRVALANALHVSAFVQEGPRKAKVARIQEALELRRSLYGEDHTGVAEILNDMALMLEPIDPQAADTLLERAVDINARIHGPDHTQTLTMMNNLAGRWRDSGHHSKAEPLYREVLRRREAAYPENRLAKAYTLHGLGWSISELGRPEEGEKHLREAIALIEGEGLGSEHLIYHLGRNTLGHSLALQGRYEEASALLRQSYEWVVENHPDAEFTAFMLDRLISLYDDWGRPAIAAEYRARRQEWDRQAASR